MMFLWMFLAGFLGAFLDQTLALGYGLIASIILVAICGLDPREIVPIILLSQLFLALPVAFSLGRTKIKPVVKSFVLLTTVFTIMIPPVLRRLNKDEISILYLVTLSSVIILYLLRNKIKFQKGYLVGAFSLLAALDKTVVGGGLSAIFVAIQTMFGIEIKDALLSLPILKALPVGGALLGYIASGLRPSILPSLIMTIGALAGTYTARRVIKNIQMDDRLVIAFLVISALLIII